MERDINAAYMFLRFLFEKESVSTGVDDITVCVVYNIRPPKDEVSQGISK